MDYVIHRATGETLQANPWVPGGWGGVPSLEIGEFHEKSSKHRPKTHVKVAHDGLNLHLAFRVDDQYVRAVQEGYQALVSRDSCVEFFIEPIPGRGYFNFEWNCGGLMLVYFIEDPTRVPHAFFRKYTVIPWELGQHVAVQTSLPARVDPEIATPLTWTLRATIPVSFFERYLGALGSLSNQTWRGNFFKCGDDTSHPHWASWAPIGEVLRFHQPQFFAPLILE